jgi:(p)ppGpp synthase/HD superfamily hydrolase
MRDIIQEAAEFAKAKHASQKRKYTGEPYTNHLQEVANILHDHDMPPTVIAAGWLHDALEDTETTKEELKEKFGPMVAGFVEEVTDVSKPEDGNRAVRKAKDRDHLAQSSPAGAAIKLADLVSNTRNIVQHDPDFAVVYLREKVDLLTVLGHGPESLYKLAVATLLDGYVKLGDQLSRGVAQTR